MKTTQGYFFPHCEDENCCLGEFRYTCPHCNQTHSNYELWWKEKDIRLFNPETFTCDGCSKPLTVKYVEEEYEYMVHETVPL